MKLYLTKAEQKYLLANGTITIEREPVLTRTHKSSIIHGVGTKQIWNKVDRIWVYGDIKDYESGKTHVINSLLGMVITLIGIPVYYLSRRKN